MTNSTLHSAEGQSGMGLSGRGDGRYASTVWFESQGQASVQEGPLPDGRGSVTKEALRYAGVRYEIRRISFGRRIELARRIREVGRKAEYLEAGNDVHDKLEATVLGAEIERVYLDWGLVGVEGIEIDGEAATPQSLIDAGPVELVAEILGRIKAECGLTDNERKN
jgi:hypothetical protein